MVHHSPPSTLFFTTSPIPACQLENILYPRIKCVAANLYIYLYISNLQNKTKHEVTKTPHWLNLFANVLDTVPPLLLYPCRFCNLSKPKFIWLDAIYVETMFRDQFSLMFEEYSTFITKRQIKLAKKRNPWQYYESRIGSYIIYKRNTYFVITS